VFPFFLLTTLDRELVVATKGTTRSDAMQCNQILPELVSPFLLFYFQSFDKSAATSVKSYVVRYAIPIT
jgi:hypothetical protein